MVCLLVFSLLVWALEEPSLVWRTLPEPSLSSETGIATLVCLVAASELALCSVLLLFLACWL